MADEEQVKLLKSGVAAWNKWREENPEAEVDLRGADLIRENLRGVYLSEAKLIGVDLSGAHLDRAHLNGAQLHGASLHRASLHRANLHRVDPWWPWCDSLAERLGRGRCDANCAKSVPE